MYPVRPPGAGSAPHGAKRRPPPAGNNAGVNIYERFLDLPNTWYVMYFSSSAKRTDVRAWAWPTTTATKGSSVGGATLSTGTGILALLLAEGHSARPRSIFGAFGRRMRRGRETQGLRQDVISVAERAETVTEQVSLKYLFALPLPMIASVLDPKVSKRHAPTEPPYELIMLH